MRSHLLAGSMQALKYIVIGILLGLIFSAAILLVSSPPISQPVEILPTLTPAPLTIYVTGAVRHPDIHILPPGSRIVDALEIAGGSLAEADLSSLNLAQRLFDGQMIYVANQNEAQNQLTKIVSPEPPIELNQATLEQLMQLPGIGQTKAEEIIAYRQKINGFDKIEQIQEVPGIGPVLFGKIKDLIMVAPKD